MRHGRAKQTRKTLQFYERTIANFPRSGQPFHVLLDGTFIVTAMKYNIPFYERMVRLLGCPTLHSPPVQPKSGSNNKRRANSSPIGIKANLYFYVCSSTITELQTLLKRQQPATSDTQDLSTFVAIEKAIAWCQSKHNIGYELNILEACTTNAPIDMDFAPSSTKKGATQESALSPAASDIWHHLMLVASSTTASSETVVSGPPPKFKNVYYMIATQDPNLLYRCRSQQSPIPILRFGAPKSGCVLLLDPPSHKATSNASYNERVKWFHHHSIDPPPPTESSGGSSLKRNESNPTPASRPRVVKKAKGPNPLSCKKKRTTDAAKNSTGQQNDEPKRKRRRKTNDSSVTPATQER